MFSPASIRVTRVKSCEAGVTFATHGHNDLSSFGLSSDLMSTEAFAEAVDVVHPIRDVHVTLLHLLGLDDNRLTYFSGGRFKQLSQFGGKVIPELISLSVRLHPCRPLRLPLESSPC
jgi:hypothetical protein